MTNEQKSAEIISWVNKLTERFEKQLDEKQQSELGLGLVYENGKVAIGSLKAPYYVEEFNLVPNGDSTWTWEFVSKTFVC